MTGWPLSFEEPMWLWLMLAIPAVAVGSMRWLAALERPRRIAATVLRGAVIAALAAALARVEIVKRSDDVAVMCVLDRSRSIPEALREASQDYVRRLARKGGSDDRFGIIGFDGSADVDLISSSGGVDVVSFGQSVAPDRTDIAAGLRMAMASFPDGYARRIVLISDGNENVGSVLREADAAAASGVAIDVVPLTYAHEAEILFDRIVVPAHASRDTRLNLRLIIRSRRPTRARLALYHNDQPIALDDPVVVLEGEMRPNRFTVPVELPSAGAHRFEAHITPLSPEEDGIAANNRATAFTFVGARGQVLLLTKPGAQDDEALYDALRRENIDIKMQSVDQLAIDLLVLQEYSAVILANMAANVFTETQQQALASYVRDFGGGLVLVGGDESFGAGGWTNTPIEEISPVAFSTPDRQQLPSAALVLVLDRSGSMGSPVAGTHRTQQVIANESAVLALQTLLLQDQIGVVAFDGAPEWIVPLQQNSNPHRVARQIRSIPPGGGTQIYPALEYAYHALAAAGDGPAIKHVILLTDGQSAEGPYASLVQNMVNAGITLSTIGVGDGVNDELLNLLAAGAGGHYYTVRSAQLLPQVIFRESGVLRQRLLSNETFTPQLEDGYSPLLTGLQSTAMPPLDGLVITYRKPDSLVPLVRRAEDGTSNPLLAHWNVELGKVVAFTSGWWPRWGHAWASWEQFGKFWAQTVRWAARQEASADFDVVTRVEGSTGHVLVEALDKQAGYVNFLRFTGRLLTPSLESTALELFQTGPGRYEGKFEVKDHGNYLVGLQYSAPNRPGGLVRTGVSVPYSPEYRDMEANVGLLRQVAQRTGGRWFEPMDPQADELFSRDLPPVVARRPVWWEVIAWLLLPLFVLDVACRRLASVVAMSVYAELAVLVVGVAAMRAVGAAWWGYLGEIVLAEAVGWSIRYRSILPTLQFFTHGVRAVAQVGQRSTGALSQLKDVREQVRGRFEAEIDREAGEPAARIPSKPRRERSRRFEADDQAEDASASDLAETLGGAAASKDELAARAAAAARDKADRPPEDGMTSRLLKAKKRAKERLDEQREDS